MHLMNWLRSLCLTLFLFSLTTTLHAEELYSSLGLSGAYVLGGSSSVGVKSPGGSLEGYYRFGRWWGGGGDVIIHRIINRDTYWTQILVVGDVHLLDTDSRLDLAVGGGFGDSILAKKQGIGLIFRVTSNYWMTERLGLSLSGNFIHVVGLDDPSSHPSFSAGGMNAGLKYRF